MAYIPPNLNRYRNYDADFEKYKFDIAVREAQEKLIEEAHELRRLERQCEQEEYQRKAMEERQRLIDQHKEFERVEREKRWERELEYKRQNTTTMLEPFFGERGTFQIPLSEANYKAFIDTRKEYKLDVECNEKTGYIYFDIGLKRVVFDNIEKILPAINESRKYLNESSLHAKYRFDQGEARGLGRIICETNPEWLVQETEWLMEFMTLNGFELMPDSYVVDDSMYQPRHANGGRIYAAANVGWWMRLRIWNANNDHVPQFIMQLLFILGTVATVLILL